MTDNTLFCVGGPMQSWGTSSRFQSAARMRIRQVRRDRALALRRRVFGGGDSRQELDRLAPLSIGVRVDLPGILEWDYHTAGAKIGIRKREGGIKRTGSTKEYETLLSRRQYLFDASFLVALTRRFWPHRRVLAGALNDPVWPVFLGRKCCVPSEPVFIGTADASALSSMPYRRFRGSRGSTRLTAWIGAARERCDSHLSNTRGFPPPDEGAFGSRCSRAFGFNNRARGGLCRDRLPCRWASPYIVGSASSLNVSILTAHSGRNCGSLGSNSIITCAPSVSRRPRKSITWITKTSVRRRFGPCARFATMPPRLWNMATICGLDGSTRVTRRSGR